MNVRFQYGGLARLARNSPAAGQAQRYSGLSSPPSAAPEFFHIAVGMTVPCLLRRGRVDGGRLSNDRNPERRPNPDALLALAEKGKRGRLLVFIGAAPGVGKTYAMLQRARVLKQEGVDVVIGLVETHGRAETEALTRGLEILPRRKVEWQGRKIEEFDSTAR